jgi:hypothetical protein
MGLESSFIIFEREMNKLNINSMENKMFFGWRMDMEYGLNGGKREERERQSFLKLKGNKSSL